MANRRPPTAAVSWFDVGELERIARERVRVTGTDRLVGEALEDLAAGVLKLAGAVREMAVERYRALPTDVPHQSCARCGTGYSLTYVRCPLCADWSDEQLATMQAKWIAAAAKVKPSQPEQKGML